MATYFRLFVTVVFTGLMRTIAEAGGVTAMPFVDGRWQGDVVTSSSPNNSEFEECLASTTFDDGTKFALTKRREGTWYLQLTNPSWRLPPTRQYAMVARVDFYPPLAIAGEAVNQTLLEIADLDQISLLALIENGHTIDLASDGFNGKYDLEGSAKVIERIRSCFADHPVAEKSATIKEPSY